jgi:ATP-binding cassette, subfamily C (CFTR/MRP), member 1
VNGDLPSKEADYHTSGTPSQENTRSSKEVADVDRQTGDMQIYAYYVKAVGWSATIVFVIAIIGFVVCLSFPSKCYSPSRPPDEAAELSHSR